MHVLCDSSPGCFGLQSRCHFCEAFCKLGWHLRMPMDGCWEDLSVAGGQARVPVQAVGPRKPHPVSPWKWQLWWGTCHSYRGPLFSDEVGKTQPCLVWLSCLHFNFKPFISACFPVFENKFFFVLLHRGRGALGNSRGSFGSLPHLGLGSSAPFIVPLPTVTPVQRGGQCLIFKPVLLLFSYRCFLSLLPQNVLIWHHKHRPTGLEGPHGVA